MWNIRTAKKYTAAVIRATNPTFFTPEELKQHRETYGDNTLGIYDFSTSEWSSMQFKPENISITGNYNTVYFDFSLSGFAEI